MRAVLLPVLFAGLVYGTTAAESEIMRSFMKLDKLRTKHSDMGQSPAYAAELKKFRGTVDNYVTSHEGKELDESEWGVVFMQVYNFLGEFCCPTYGESERLVWEGRQLLENIKPSDWRLPHKLATYLAAGHVNRWQDREPVFSAHIFDIFENEILSTNDKQLIRLWYMRTAPLQVNFMWHSDEMRPTERDDFYFDREGKVLTCLRNSMVALDYRTHILSLWAHYLVRRGRPEQAAKVLYSWRQQYGEQVYQADYCRIWLETALFGQGDWEEAQRALNAATARAKRWTNTSHKGDYEIMCRIYYDNFLLPGYELQRRRAAELKTWRKEIVRKGGG